MEKHTLIRKIYLYTFSLAGLVLMIIGGVRFLDMGLKAFVFTKADEEQRMYSKVPPTPYPIEKLERLENQETGKEGLTQTEKEQLQQAIAAYKNWEEQNKNFDPISSRRHRDASINLALILIGLPLYLYHWLTVKRETRN